MSRFDLSREDLASLLPGEPTYRLDQVWDGIHRLHLEPHELTTVPKALRSRLADAPEMAPAWRIVDEAKSDKSATLKWVLEGVSGALVETVVMRYRDRTTVCVSSQAGCAMACSFCATGQLGFGRQLTSGEITEQVVRAARQVTEAGWGRLGNIVLMGMGEPLANYGNVFSSIRRCNEALGIGARSITVSTVGVVPGIVKMAADPLQVNLAVSLHAANDRLRSSLVPLNDRYPLARLMAACDEYSRRTHRRITFEWACIAGVNDRHSDASELAELARPLRAHVNLIPLNPTPGYLVAGSSAERVEWFRDRLDAFGVNATIRDTRGRDVDAACGQLAAGLEPGRLRTSRSRTRPGRAGAAASQVAITRRLA